MNNLPAICWLPCLLRFVFAFCARLCALAVYAMAYVLLAQVSAMGCCSLIVIRFDFGSLGNDWGYAHHRNHHIYTEFSCVLRASADALSSLSLCDRLMCVLFAVNGAAISLCLKIKQPNLHTWSVRPSPPHDAQWLAIDSRTNNKRVLLCAVVVVSLFVPQQQLVCWECVMCYLWIKVNPSTNLADIILLFTSCSCRWRSLFIHQFALLLVLCLSAAQQCALFPVFGEYNCVFISSGPRISHYLGLAAERTLCLEIN